jgi:hypothetical protein
MAVLLTASLCRAASSTLSSTPSIGSFFALLLRSAMHLRACSRARACAAQPSNARSRSDGKSLVVDRFL